jgi:hypothetical protein
MKQPCRFIFLVSIAVLLGSCTVQKRLYRPGFYVDMLPQKKTEHVQPGPETSAATLPLTHSYSGMPAPLLGIHLSPSAPLWTKPGMISHKSVSQPGTGNSHISKPPTIKRAVKPEQKVAHSQKPQSDVLFWIMLGFVFASLALLLLVIILLPWLWLSGGAAGITAFANAVSWAWLGVTVVAVVLWVVCLFVYPGRIGCGNL